MGALIHPPPQGDPGGLRRLDRKTKSAWARTSVPFVRKGGTGRGGECPERPPVGRPRGNPDLLQFLANLSNLLDERFPHTG